MAPEQQRDASNVDEKADIYSLGKVIEDIVTNGVNMMSLRRI